MRKLFALPWHRSTYVVAAVTALLMVVIAFPGEITSPLAGNFGGAYTATYDHGWPLTFLARGYRYDFSQPKMFPDIPKWGVPWLAWDSWQIWEMNNARSYWSPEDVNSWKPVNLVVDFVVALLVVITLATLWERRRRRSSRLMTFSLRDAALVMTAAACLLGWGAHAQHVHIRELKLVGTLDQLAAYGYESSIAPQWLQRLVGTENLPELFLRVDELEISVTDQEELQKVIRICKEFKWLKTVEVHDLSMMQLAGLQALPQLEVLKVCFDELSAEQIASLAALQQLHTLFLDHENDAYKDELQARLPNCKVINDWADLEPDW